MTESDWTDRSVARFGFGGCLLLLCGPYVLLAANLWLAVGLVATALVSATYVVAFSFMSGMQVKEQEQEQKQRSER